MRWKFAAVVVLASMPFAAAAQSWQQYNYTDAGFSAQFPNPPNVSDEKYKTASGIEVPAKIFASRNENIVYSVTVADFTNTALDNDKAIDDAVKIFSAGGEIKADVNERVNRQHGRELTVIGKDASHSSIAIFFFDHKLYALEGRALPPNAEAGSANTLRFQQSLQFAMNGGSFGGAPGENANDGPPGGGPGGPGGGAGGGRFGRDGLRAPPPQAFAACKGKSAGDTVQQTTPAGDQRPALCTQSPQGLFARLNRRPPPPEAFDACQGKKLGDAVQFDTPRGLQDSTCIQTPEGLAARPNNRAGRDPAFNGPNG